MMKLHRGRELVGFYSFEAFDKITSELVAKWKEPTARFLESAYDAVCETLEKVVDDPVLVADQFCALRPVVSGIWLDAVLVQREKANKLIEKFDMLEAKKYTVNVCIHTRARTHTLTITHTHTHSHTLTYTHIHSHCSTITWKLFPSSAPNASREKLIRSFLLISQVTIT